MSESPWAKRPAPAAPAAAASRAPNWGFFLAVTLIIGLGSGMAMGALQAMTGFAIPDFVVSLLVTFITVGWSGSRYLKSVDYYWTRDDRHRVGLAYTGETAALNVVMIALAGWAVSAGYGPQLGLPAEVVDLGWTTLGIVVAIALPLALAFNYGINRLVLFHFVNGKARARPRDVSDTFS